MKKIFKLFAIVILAGLSLTGCKNSLIDNPFFKTNVSENKNEIAYLSFGINEGTDRKIAPETLSWNIVNSIELTANGSALKTWTYSAEKGTAYAQMKADETVILNAGTYTFEVTLKDAAGDILQTGKLEDVVITGGENPLNFKTKAWLEGTGKLKIICSGPDFGEKIHSIKYSYENLLDGISSVEQTKTNNSDNDYLEIEVPNIPCGEYIVSVTFVYDDETLSDYDDNPREYIHELVEIQNKRETVFNCNYTNGKSVYCPIEYWNQVPNGSPVKAEFVNGYEPSSYIIGEPLPSEEQIIRPAACDGLTFAGWYLGNNKVTKLTEPSSETIVLYAHWIKAVVDADGFDDNSNNFTVMPNDETWAGVLAKIKSLPDTKKVMLDLSNLSIPEISQELLKDCTTLEEVILPSGITAIGDSAFSGCTSLTGITIPSGVTTIGANAFNGCTLLTEMTIPESVTSIGDGAFDGCSELKTFTIPEKYIVYFLDKLNSSAYSFTVIIDEETTNISFWNCEGLKIVVFPENSKLETIRNAFHGCKNLEEITIPSSVTQIDSEAFKGCSSLKKVIFKDDSQLTEISDYAFQNCTSLEEITLPSEVTIIGEYAFNGCTSLQTVTMSDKVTEIEESAFDGCTSLSDVTLSNTLEWIYSQAFNGCTALTEITIPKSLTYCYDDAFSGCTNLNIIIYETQKSKFGPQLGSANYSVSVIINEETTEMPSFNRDSGLKSVIIPENSKLETIGYYAFQQCTKLTEITIPSGVTTIGDSAFYGCTSLAEITIPSSVTTIGTNAFSGCTSIRKITIPSSVTTIEESAFKECSGMTELEIPSGVTTIGNSAFENCYSLLKCTMSDTVTSIGIEAFSNCTLLRKITLSNALKKIDWYTFKNCEKLPEITIPESVTAIDEDAFVECDVLKTFTIYSNQMEFFEDVLDDSSYTFNVIVKDGTTEITNTLFPNYAGLKSVTIPESVTTISDNAFAGCENLKTFTIYSNQIGFFEDEFDDSSYSITVIAQDGANISAIYNKPGLETIIIPEGVTLGSELPKNIKINSEQIEDYRDQLSDPDYSFTVVVTDGTTYIKNNAFYGCAGLSSVIIPEGVTAICTNAFQGCTKLTSIVLPETLTKIDESAFADCSQLTSIEIPQKVTEIGYAAFRRCTSLTSIDIPQGVSTIEQYAFYQCSSLTSVTIPDSVTKIDQHAFEGCTELTSIVIPQTVTEINSNSFDGCDKLKTFTIPSNIAETFYSKIISSGYEFTIIAKDGANLSSFYDSDDGLKTVIVSSGVTLTGDLPHKLTIYSGQIDSYTDELKDSSYSFDLIVEDGTGEIFNGTFENCLGLKSVTFTSQVTSVNNEAFVGCSNLKTFTIYESQKQYFVDLINNPDYSFTILPDLY